MLFREFYSGSDADLTKAEREVLEGLFASPFYVKKEIEYSYVSTRGAVNRTVLAKWREYLDKYREFILPGTHFANLAVQEPHGVMILRVSYGQTAKEGRDTADFTPYFGTDVGICSIIKPQLNFNASLDDFPFWKKLFQANSNIAVGSEVGKANGLSVLLDAETFDYTYHLKVNLRTTNAFIHLKMSKKVRNVRTYCTFFCKEKCMNLEICIFFALLFNFLQFQAGEGFKLSVHHHLDQPIMSIKEIDISVGTESQVKEKKTYSFDIGIEFFFLFKGGC